MALFLVVALQSAEGAVDATISAKIPSADAFEVESGKWVIESSLATSSAVSESLGLAQAATYFIVPVRGYFGRAQPSLWEWLAAKTSKPNA